MTHNPAGCVKHAFFLVKGRAEIPWPFQHDSREQCSTMQIRASSSAGLPPFWACPEQALRQAAPGHHQALPWCKAFTSR